MAEITELTGQRDAEIHHFKYSMSLAHDDLGCLPFSKGQHDGHS